MYSSNSSVVYLCYDIVTQIYSIAVQTLQAENSGLIQFLTTSLALCFTWLERNVICIYCEQFFSYTTCKLTCILNKNKIQNLT